MMPLNLTQLLTDTPNTPLSRTLRTTLTPFSWLYGLAVQLRNAAYDHGLLRTEKLPRPLISLGNITVGGTGKTPMTILLVRLLQNLGAHPAVLLRGYGAPVHPDGPSEETELLRQALGPDIPVQADPDRLSAARHLLQHQPHIDVFVLDDGFQHRKLFRDLDLVLIDATQPLQTSRLLPAGLLREPLTNLRRAHGLILTRLNLAPPHHIQQLRQHLENLGPPVLAAVTMHWTAFRDRHDQVLSLDDLCHQPILGVCGLGNPTQFHQMLQNTFPHLCGLIPLRDHQLFTASLVRWLCQQARRAGAQAILTTDKDWLKWRRFAADAPPQLPVYRPVLELKIVEGQDRLLAVLRQLLPKTDPQRSQPAPSVPRTG